MKLVIHPRSLTASLPLKNDDWKTTLFLWDNVYFQGAKGENWHLLKKCATEQNESSKHRRFRLPMGSKIKKSCRFPGFSSKRCLGHPNLQHGIQIYNIHPIWEVPMGDVSCYQLHLLSEAASPIKMTYSSQAGGGTKFEYEKDSTDLEPAWSNHPDFETCLPML